MANATAAHRMTDWESGPARLSSHFHFENEVATFCLPPTSILMRGPASMRSPGGVNPMGEGQKQEFQLSFNRFLRVAFQGSRATSNGGLILVRELDERLGFGELIEQHLTDSRASNARFSFGDLLRQSVYSRLAGYEDVNDAERLSQD